MNLRQEP